MSETGGKSNAKLAGGLAGAAVAVVLIAMGMFIIGIIAGLLVGVVLAAFVGKKNVGAAPAQEETSVAEPETVEAAPVAQEIVAPTTEPAAAPKWKPSTPLAGEAELASRKGTWRYQGA